MNANERPKFCGISATTLFSRRNGNGAGVAEAWRCMNLVRECADGDAEVDQELSLLYISVNVCDTHTLVLRCTALILSCAQK